MYTATTTTVYAEPTVEQAKAIVERDERLTKEREEQIDAEKRYSRIRQLGKFLEIAGQYDDAGSFRALAVQELAELYKVERHDEPKKR